MKNIYLKKYVAEEQNEDGGCLSFAVLVETTGEVWIEVQLNEEIFYLDPRDFASMSHNVIGDLEGLFNSEDDEDIIH